MEIFLIYEIFDNGIWDDYEKTLVKAFQNEDDARTYANTKNKEQTKGNHVFYLIEVIIAE